LLYLRLLPVASLIILGYDATASSNLFGFNEGYPLLRGICDSADIIMLQEHWLPPFDLHILDNVNCDFTAFASSAMSQAVKSDILKCRPYGGVAFLIRLVGWSRV